MTDARPEQRDALVFDAAGERVGRVVQLFRDPESQRLAWASVSQSRLGSREALLPLAGAQFRDGAFHVAYPADLIRRAPRPARPHELTAHDQDELNAHYGRRG